MFFELVCQYRPVFSVSLDILNQLLMDVYLFQKKNVRSIEELYSVFLTVTISGQIMQQKYIPNEHKEKCWY